MRSVVSLLLTGVVFGFSGCGGEEVAPPEVLVPVTGTVKVADKPAGGVMLTFIPQPGTKGTGGYAATDEQGNFTVSHRSNEPGIEPGTYKIVASRFLQPNGQPIPSGESAADLNATESLPARFTDVANTPLSANVEAGSSEPMAIEIPAR